MSKIGKRNFVGQEVKASYKSMRISPRKLNLVASSIRYMKVAQAIVHLTFCQKRISQDVKKCLLSAVANADNNMGMDIDTLYVKEAIVGKAIVMKRMHPRARGRSASIKKFFSHLFLTLGQVGE